MNKYQVVLNWVSAGNDSCGTEWDLLQELVDKETPMKPIGLEDEYNVTYVIKFTHMCSHCNDNFLSISDKYCKECGQKIDWSDEDFED